MDAVALCWRRGIDPREVAREVVRAPAQLAALGEVAANLDAPLPVRVVALAAVVDAAAIGDLEVPEVLADAVDDLALVDAAVAARRGWAVCAALHRLGPRPDLATTRRRVVRRLVAAGVAGLPLAGLALAIGDLAPGAALAARDFRTTVAPRLDLLVPDHAVAAWARWVARLPAAAAGAVLVAVGDEVPALLRHADDEVRRKLSSILGGP